MCYRSGIGVNFTFDMGANVKIMGSKQFEKINKNHGICLEWQKSSQLLLTGIE